MGISNVKIYKYRFIVLAILAFVGACNLNFAFASSADTYPEKPITIIVPYPPGAFNDTLGRLVGKKLSDIWGKPVVVENKPGAGTTIGTSFVAKSAPDGYTIMVSQFPFAANPFLRKSLPYDTLKDFEPIVLAGRAPMILIVNEKSSITSVSELIRVAKKSPGAINYGSSGPGSSEHLAMVVFEQMAGVKLNQVPYKGSSPLMTDLAGGQVEVAIEVYPMARPFVQSGKVRALAIAGSERSNLMPEVPTLSELGVKGYDVSSWHGFIAPAGTPKPIIEKLNTQINGILKQEDVQKLFKEQGVIPDGGTPMQFDVFVRKQMDLWKKVVNQSGIQPE